VRQQQRVAVAFLFAIETAMRAGEICGLMQKNINLSDRTAKILQTKNGHPRTVPLSSEAIRLIKRLEPWPGDRPIFIVSSGVLSTMFKKAVKLTGIENLTFHDTRHEATTRLAEIFDVLELARVTGHRDIKQLMTYYNKPASALALKLS
jgi:integrase